MEHSPSSRDLARVIERAREEAGASERELARLSGIPASTFHRKMRAVNGRSAFDYEELLAIAQALGLKLSVLIVAAEAEAESVAVPATV